MTLYRAEEEREACAVAMHAVQYAVQTIRLAKERQNARLYACGRKECGCAADAARGRCVNGNVQIANICRLFSTVDGAMPVIKALYRKEC